LTVLLHFSISDISVLVVAFSAAQRSDAWYFPSESLSVSRSVAFTLVSHA